MMSRRIRADEEVLLQSDRTHVLCFVAFSFEESVSTSSERP
jgi:hypothetical protein